MRWQANIHVRSPTQIQRCASGALREEIGEVDRLLPTYAELWIRANGVEIDSCAIVRQGLVWHRRLHARSHIPCTHAEIQMFDEFGV